MVYVEAQGTRDGHVLHWVRQQDADLAAVIPPTAICGRPVVIAPPQQPARPCMNCARRKAAYENRSRHRLITYRV